MYKYIRDWGARLKELFKLYHFIGLKNSSCLFVCWLQNLFFHPQAGIVSYDIKRITFIKKWLSDRYDYLIPKTFDTETSDSLHQTNATIWVFWYQGEDAMPDIVKICYASICKQSNGYLVILLTKNNIHEYVKLPDYIYEKVNDGSISYTHFSDVLRINLLFNYGGIWMDSTLFVTQPIQMKLYNGLFYSIKNRPHTHGTISNYRWAGFYLYSQKGSAAFKVFIDLFDSYWKDNNSLIEYFLIDYFFDMLYNKNSIFKQTVDSISYSNPKLHFFINELNKPFDENILEEYLNETSVFKFNYRNRFERQMNGKLTFYGFLVEKYLAV